MKNILIILFTVFISGCILKKSNQPAGEIYKEDFKKVIDKYSIQRTFRDNLIIYHGVKILIKSYHFEICLLREDITKFYLNLRGVNF